MEMWTRHTYEIRQGAQWSDSQDQSIAEFAVVPIRRIEVRLRMLRSDGLPDVFLPGYDWFLPVVLSDA